MKIKELCESERPREKMLSGGAEALSSGELLAVLLRTGSSGKNVLELSQEILSCANGSLITLSGMSLGHLLEIDGMGKGKAATIMACFELGRRLFAERSAINKTPITSPKKVFELIIPTMLGLDHEECWVIFLNTAQYCTGMQRLSSGGQSATIVDVKEVIRLALERKAAHIVLTHNHPSGNPRPSQEDLRQTAALKKALTPMGIGLIDHVIVCDDCYFSFSDDATSSAFS
ncbi:MAG: DNA repair protein RadC [Bacteroidales bacterium]|nr:DNA repair protein RadC [Bacteroidales bacterium]